MKQLTENQNSKYFLKVLSITKQGEKENNTCIEFICNVFEQLLNSINTILSPLLI